MNKADFIVASTYQEIAGTEESIGQYESHQFFTLPGLYQAVGGVNLFTPKFNIVPPGVDEFLYFPYTENERRVESQTRHWERRLFSEQSDDIRGWLRDASLPPLFTLSRLDRIKNLSGLVDAFGRHPRLREHYNLILAGGATIHPDRSRDREERAEIEKILELVERHDLGGSFRWLPGVEKDDTGEVYRVIADRRGVFVQPALFEAFGLTVLEAMVSGLPTFATRFGGPSEIIEDGVSGFLVNTSMPELIAEAIWRFEEAREADENRWEEVSRNGIRRIRECFTWGLHAERLVTLSKLYGFWRYAVAGEGMVKLDRYCDLLYHLLIRRRPRIWTRPAGDDPAGPDDIFDF